MSVISQPDARDVYALDFAADLLHQRPRRRRARPAHRLFAAARLRQARRSRDRGAVAKAAAHLREPRRQGRGGRSRPRRRSDRRLEHASGGRAWRWRLQAFGDRAPKLGRSRPAGGRRARRDDARHRLHARPARSAPSCTTSSCASTPALRSAADARRCRCRPSRSGDLVPPSGEWGTAWSDWAPFSYPFNLTQQPAASVPCGFTGEGLPDRRCRSSARSAPTTWCCAPAAPSRRPHPFAMLDAPRQTLKACARTQIQRNH